MKTIKSHLLRFCLVLAALSISSISFSQEAEGDYWVVHTITYESADQMNRIKEIVNKYQPKMLKALSEDGVVLDEIAMFNEVGPSRQAVFMHKVASWADINSIGKAFEDAWNKVLNDTERKEVDEAFKYINKGSTSQSNIYRETYSRE